MKILLILLGLIKIIGFVLLGILILLLFMFLCILLSPIRYEIEGEKKEVLAGSFHVRWLFRIIHIYGVYREQEEILLCGKVFGIPVFGGKKKEKKPKKKKDKRRKKEPVIPAYEADYPDISMQSRPDREEQEDNREDNLDGLLEAEQAPSIKDEEFMVENELEKEILLQEEPVTSRGGIRRIPMVEIIEEKPIDWETEPSSFEFEDEEDQEHTQNKERFWHNRHVQYLLHLEGKEKVFKNFLSLIKRLFHGVLPRDLFLKATIGTGDPALTGYVLAAAGVAKAKFGHHLQIKGEFTRLTLEDVLLRIKGKIGIGYLLYAVLRFVLTREVRKTIWYYWKGE